MRKGVTAPHPWQGALTHGDRRATESRDLSKYNFENKVPGRLGAWKGGVPGYLSTTSDLVSLLSMVHGLSPASSAPS